MKFGFLLIIIFYSYYVFGVDCKTDLPDGNRSENPECFKIYEHPEVSGEGNYLPFKGDSYSRIKNCLENKKNYELVKIHNDEHELSNLDRAVGTSVAYPWSDDLEGKQALEMFGTKLFLKRVFSNYSNFTPPELFVEISNQLSCREVNTEVALFKTQFNYLFSSGKVVTKKIVPLGLDKEKITIGKLKSFIQSVNDAYQDSFEDKVTYFNPNMVQRCIDTTNCSCCGSFDESAKSMVTSLKKSFVRSKDEYEETVNSLIRKYKAVDCFYELEEPDDAFIRSKKVSISACIKKDENLRNNYQLAKVLYAKANDKSLKISLRKDLLSKSGALFTSGGFEREGKDVLKDLIDISKEEGNKDEEFFFRAQLAMANKNFSGLRANYKKISTKHPSKEYLKKIIDKIDNIELLYKTYAMAESLINTLISFLENRGDGDRFEIDELKALLSAWKFRLESGDFETTVELLNDIQSSRNTNAKKALGFLKNIGPRKSKQLKGSVYISENIDLGINGSVYDPLMVILEIENSIRKKESYPLYDIFSHNYNYYDGPWYKTAHQSIAYSAREFHPELKKDADRLINYTFNSKASGVIDFLKGVTDPLMIASAGLARITTAKVIGTIFGSGAKGLKVTVATIGVESAGFVVYDKALREALTNDNVDWGPDSVGKGWADLSLRFAFAHAITRPLASTRRVMANSSLLGKTVKKSGKHRDLNIVGKGIDVALTQLGTTTAFYIGGKIGHTVGLNDHESTFADEAKMLLQFQLGMKLAGNLIRPIGRERREKEKIVVNAATIAEKITGKREGSEFELVTFSLIESASKSPNAKRSQARMRERLSRETGELSSSAQRRLKSVLEAAGLKVESVARVKVVNGKEVTIGEVSPRWEKLLKEIEGCK